MGHQLRNPLVVGGDVFRGSDRAPVDQTGRQVFAGITDYLEEDIVGTDDRAAELPVEDPNDARLRDPAELALARRRRFVRQVTAGDIADDDVDSAVARGEHAAFEPAIVLGVGRCWELAIGSFHAHAGRHRPRESGMQRERNELAGVPTQELTAGRRVQKAGGRRIGRANAPVWAERESTLVHPVHEVLRKADRVELGGGHLSL